MQFYFRIWIHGLASVTTRAGRSIANLFQMTKEEFEKLTALHGECGAPIGPSSDAPSAPHAPAPTQSAYGFGPRSRTHTVGKWLWITLPHPYSLHMALDHAPAPMQSAHGFDHASSSTQSAHGIGPCFSTHTVGTWHWTMLLHPHSQHMALDHASPPTQSAHGIGPRFSTHTVGTWH